MFKDRKDAAIQLAKALEKYQNKHALILGIPRGGVETAYYVARALEADFSILVCRKLNHPDSPEVGFGAIAEDGSLFINPEISKHLPPEVIEQEIAVQRTEIERRKLIIRKGEALPSIRYRLIILVDDGIATGATLFSAIKMCKKHGARRIVVAAPVAAWETKIELEQIADEVVVLETPFFFRSVSQSYINFEDLSDEASLHFMEKWKREQSIKKLRAHRDLL